MAKHPCSLLLSICLTLALFSGFQVFTTAHEVLVDPGASGRDVPGCINGTFPCKTLEYAANNIENDTVIVIASSRLEVENVVLLVGLHNISMIGISNGTLIECTCAHTNSCGLRIKRSYGVELINVSISSCGARGVLNGTDIWLTSGVFISDSGNVVMEYVSVTNSRGYGMFMVNLYGDVFVDNCAFSNNARSDQVNITGASGGSGLFILISVCSFNSSSCSDGHNSPVGNYIINNSFFLNNSVSLSPNVSIDLWDLYCGGGLTILMQWGALGNEFTISNSLFSDNVSPEGAGMCVICQGDCTNNTLLVQDCLFCDNSLAEFSLGGGGAVLGLKSNYLVDFPTGNAFRFKSSNFTRNTVNYGGGLLIFSASQSQYTTYKNAMEFSECKWEGNSGSISPAVEIDPSFTGTLDTAFLVQPVFSDCQIIGNKIVNEVEASSLTFSQYAGVFLALKLTVKFSGRNIFKDNVGTALYLDSALAIFLEWSSVLLQQNTGHNGGAVGLSAYSSIRYENNTEFHFENNSATFGGAIYVVSYSQHESISSHACFIDYVDRHVSLQQKNVTFYFQNNAAHSGFGHTLSLSSIQPCRYACHYHSNDLPDVNEVFGNQSCLAKFYFQPENIPKNIVTAASEFRISHKDEIPLKLIPGKESSIPVQLFDDLDQNVTPITVCTSELSSNSSVPGNFSTNSASHFITNDAITVLGSPGSLGNLTLSAQSFRGTATKLPFVLSSCPPGYVTSMAPGSGQSTASCHCSASLQSDSWYDGITMCNDTVGLAQISPGYWIGYIADDGQESEDNLFTAHCPLGFCDYFYHYNSSNSKGTSERSYPLIPTASQQGLEDLVCAENREGVLCSKCVVNYSVFFHSYHFKCGPNALCHLGPLFYIVSELLPITVMFLVILYWGVSLTSGMAYSIIFMVQILQPMKISVDGALQFYPQILMDILSVIYGFLNLDYFTTEELSFCLWKSANTMEIAFMKYLSVLFSLALIALFVCIQEIPFCNCFRASRFCCQVNLGQFGVRGLSAFFVVCYSQCICISFSLLSHQPLLRKGGSIYENKSVVSLNGNLFYLQGDHLYYAIPALLCILLIVVPLPAILTFDIFLIKLEGRLSRFADFRLLQSWTRLRNKLKPFLDSFQGCFRDEHRYFAGLFFVYRLAVYLISILVTDMTSYYLYLELFFLAILVLHAVVQPFEVPSHNTVALLSLSCLLLINTLTIHIYTSVIARGYTNEVILLQWIQFLFVCIPIVPFVAVVIGSNICKVLSARCAGYKEVNLEDNFDDTLHEEDDDDE